MIRAQLLTPWTGDGLRTETAFLPLVAGRYSLAECRDVTGQAAYALPPSPNLLVVEVGCSEAVLAQIEADPDFAVLWSEDDGA